MPILSNVVLYAICLNYRLDSVWKYKQIGLEISVHASLTTT
jgi:hypothetical protein